MADFLKAVAATLESEGLLSNEQHDHGGLTKFGVTSDTLIEYQTRTGLLPGKRVIDLTRDDAIALYRVLYWHFDALDSQLMAAKIFDIAINTGDSHMRQAMLFVQRACNFVTSTPIAIDGQWGPATFNALQQINAARRVMTWFKALVYFEAKLYIGLVDVDKTQVDFIDGWLIRACKRPQ